MVDIPPYWTDPLQDTFTLAVEAVEDLHLTLVSPLPFFTGGGGQPPDRVEVRLPDKSDWVPVVELLPADRVLVLEQPLPPLEGSLTVEARLDLPFRQSLMRAHTAQHLLSSILQAQHSTKTEKVVVGPDSCQLFLDRSLKPEHVAALSEEMLSHISQPCIVRSHVLEQGSDVDHRGEQVDLAKVRGYVPDSKELVRVVSIGDGLVDMNTCGGTHLSSTAEILDFAITGLRKRQLVFECGPRATSLRTEVFQTLLSLSSSLSLPLPEVLPHLQSKHAELRLLTKEHHSLVQVSFRSFLQGRLETLQGLSPSDGLVGPGGFAGPSLKGRTAVPWLAWQVGDSLVLVVEFPVVDRKVIGDATDLFEAFGRPVIFVCLGSNDQLILFTHQPQAAASDSRQLANILRQELSLKGGGKPELAMVSVKGLDNPLSGLSSLLISKSSSW